MSADRNFSNDLSNHVNLDVLVDAYYGVCDDSAAVHAHVAGCETCAERWNEIARKRAVAAESMAPRNEVSADFLAAQRRKIYERLAQPKPKLRKVWIPTAAAAALLTAAIFAWRPAPEAPHPEVRAEISDAQLFSEVYLLEQSYEPSAAAPIQALFDSQQLDDQRFDDPTFEEQRFEDQN
jgi:hypothetical protein